MKQTGTVRRFLRRNAAYMILALCVLAIGLSITLVMVNGKSSTNDFDTASEQQTVIEPTDGNIPAEPVEEPIDVTEPDTPVVKTVSFIMPVESAAAVEDYTETLAYNATLKRFQAHKAIDFFAEEGAAVYAVYDGVVSDVKTALLTGTTVTIDHGNGLFTVYNSLSGGDEVFVGQAVKQGAKIGEVSLSNRQESAEGAHLHFQTIENGEIINPAKYLSLEEK